ncbi:hypothetical protein CTAYLR_004222 [Chrysophaeum taylorii]|uniref:Uncharacterized protein n=1 Tax=Chrysophaeum taylorii TaxID=2483200 RepID=A0AAD7XL49_9STRA|nr:hypothetical protein CTAYLR_004222 [Chrysophaeum taylorii]
MSAAAAPQELEVGVGELREYLMESEVECVNIEPTAEEDEMSRMVETAVEGRRRWQSVTRWTYYLTAGSLLAIALPALIYFLASQNAAGRYYLLPVATVFVSCAVPVTCWGIAAHVNNYWQPTLQKYVIRILWMVPIYSITSLAELCLWLRVEKGSALRRWTVVPTALRDCYESYTVLNFFYFCLAFLEVSSGEPASTAVARMRDGVRHPCPPYSCACAPWRTATGEFLDRCQYGVLLYATLMPLCALALIGDAFFDRDAGSSVDATTTTTTTPKSAISALATPSALAAAVQFVVANHAIYCLGLFYVVAHRLLAPSHPHLKFVSVKGIVFGTFFQNLGIDAVFYANPRLAEAFVHSGDDVDAALGSVQSTLMCVEMLAFALLHARAFPSSEFPRITRDGQSSNDAVADASRDWLAAWGDYFAEQKQERRLWRLGGSRGRAPRGTVSTSRLIFDVSDVHHDTTATMRGLAGDVTEPIIRESHHSSSVLPRLLARWPTVPTSVAFARFVNRTSVAPPLV